MKLGHFINPYGYTDRPFIPARYERSRVFRWRTKELFDFQLDAQNPVIWVRPDGTWIMPDRHFVTDGGSLPPFIEWVSGITREKHKPAFYFHDSGAKHGGFWVSTDGGNTWRFVVMTRRQVDAVLQEILEYMTDGTPAGWTPETVDVGLAVGGWYAWRRNARKREQELKRTRSDASIPH